MAYPKVSCLNPCSSVDSALSFYGKALLIETDYYIKLQSYDTIVAMYDKKSHLVTLKGFYSMTTNRHIRSFLEYLGIDTRALLKTSEYRTFKKFTENVHEFY